MLRQRKELRFDNKHNLIASFDSILKDSGTVVDIVAWPSKRLLVEPDPPNFGKMWLLPSEVEKLSENDQSAH